MQIGDACELLVSSDDDLFRDFVAIREAYIPELDVFIGDYPFLDRTGLVLVSKAKFNSKKEKKREKRERERERERHREGHSVRVAIVECTCIYVYREGLIDVAALSLYFRFFILSTNIFFGRHNWTPPFFTKKDGADEQEDKAKLIKERKAWIGYDFANSCYATVAIATFLPLILNAYAEAEAWRGKTKPQTCSDLEEEYSENVWSVALERGICCVRVRRKDGFSRSLRCFRCR